MCKKYMYLYYKPFLQDNLFENYWDRYYIIKDL